MDSKDHGRKVGFKFSQILKPIGQVLRIGGAIASATTRTIGTQIILNPTGFAAPSGLAPALNFPSAVSTPIGGTPMAIDIGGLLGGISGVFSGSSGVLGQISNVAKIASAFVPQQTQQFQVQQIPQMPSPVLVSSAQQQSPQSGALVRATASRDVIDAGIKLLNRLGIHATQNSFASVLRRAVSSIASLARRTPTGTIVGVLTGLGLSALESNVLTAWHVQRRKGRRMNPANVHALRRAGRRIKQFHRLCQTLDTTRRPVARRKCAKVC